MSISLRSAHWGACLAPLTPASCLRHTSRIGVIPKDTPGKWRLIVDVLSPEPLSVNDGISKSLYSLAYVSVKDAAMTIVERSQGSILAKVNIAST